jgi:hypothetical protein
VAVGAGSGEVGVGVAAGGAVDDGVVAAPREPGDGLSDDRDGEVGVGVVAVAVVLGVGVCVDGVRLGGTDCVGVGVGWSRPSVPASVPDAPVGSGRTTR